MHVSERTAMGKKDPGAGAWRTSSRRTDRGKPRRAPEVRERQRQEAGEAPRTEPRSRGTSRTRGAPELVPGASAGLSRLPARTALDPRRGASSRAREPSLASTAPRGGAPRGRRYLGGIRLCQYPGRRLSCATA
jgi:hypothetical protein